MGYEISWTEPALADLEAIVQAQANRDPNAADQLLLELLATVEILERFPSIGPV